MNGKYAEVYTYTSHVDNLEGELRGVDNNINDEEATNHELESVR